MSMAANAKCGCCESTQHTIDNCSCTRESQNPVNMCRIIKYFNDKLWLRVQPQDKENFLSVAIFNIGIQPNSPNRKNEFKEATEMCGAERQGDDKLIPFCKAMIIKSLLLDQWKICPDFMILSEAHGNLKTHLKTFLPMYEYFNEQVAKSETGNEHIFLCWKQDTWEVISKKIERIEVPGFEPICRAVRFKRKAASQLFTHVTLIGVHLPSQGEKKNTTFLRELISHIPNHGVIIIGGDFNLEIHESFPSTDEILVPSYLPTAKRGCIDNIVIAKLACQPKMKVTVARREVIDATSKNILNHNPVLGVFSVENAACTIEGHKFIPWTPEQID